MVDGNGRRQAVYLVDVRLFHQSEELARVGAQGLDISALALGVDGIKRQRRLTRTRQAGDNHQLIAGDLDVDVFQIVLAGAANGDFIDHTKLNYKWLLYRFLTR